MPIIGAKGSPSSGGFGQFAQASAVPNYIEDVFSTWLYDGNSSTQTINNGIDLAGKGGLVWGKSRSAAGSNSLYDTVRGVGTAGNARVIFSNSTAAQTGPNFDYVSSFNSNGFAITSDAGGGNLNTNGTNYVSWTFREAPKFFDVVTYTGTGSAQNIAHNLGSVPGCIIVKRTNTAQNWAVQHRSAGGGTQRANLNNTNPFAANAFFWNSTDPTSTVFTVGTSDETNASGGTYVAYLFAHDAGGFGLTGTDNVISCGSFTSDSSGFATVNLGYEPQWVLYRSSSSSGRWVLSDNMRGAPASNVASGNSTAKGPVLVTELAASEADLGGNPEGHGFIPRATGFTVDPNSYQMTSDQTYIYIAIRRGPMKVPTTGASVFQPIYNTSSIGNKVNGTVGPIDLTIQGQPTGSYPSFWMTTFDRLRGSKYLVTAGTNAETGGDVFFDTNVGVRNGTWFTDGGIVYNFGRAPGFFDEVCYTGNSSARTINHNLTVAPELMLIKQRNGSTGGVVYAAPLGTNKAMLLFDNQASAAIAAYTDGSVWSNTAPTSSVFTLGNSANANTTTYTYVAYLFASCPGVSKVGSYTGTGTTQVINCGFTAGSRFIMIKRTDAAGDWYVWDSARGIVAGNDPYLLLNSTAAEVTNTDFVDTASVGFEISSTAPAAINASGGTFIFLAIA